jgi:DNA-directed RNA polymerase sigma subunit (sigma70/sigma32)
MMAKGKRVDSYSHSDVDPTVDDGNPEENAQREQLKRILPKVLNDLSPKAQQFIKMRFYKDMTMPEIAKAFGVDVERVITFQKKILTQIQRSAQAKDLEAAADPMLVRDHPAFKVGYRDAINNREPMNNFGRQGDRYMYDFGYETGFNKNAGPLRVAEESPGMDPSVIQMKKRARVAHPMAKNDEEALLLYSVDKNKEEFKDIHGEQDREMSMIKRIEKAEGTLEKEVARIDSEMAQILAMTQK